MGVDTGRRIVDYDDNGYAPGARPVRQAPQRRGMVLFDHLHQIDDPYSDVIDVKPGRAILIDAYGLTSGDQIFTNCVVKASYDPIFYEAICNRYDFPLSRQYEIAATKRMSIGPAGEAGWILTPTKNQIVIVQPGSYQFEFNTTPVPTDTLYVVAHDYPSEELNLLPKEYLGGF